MQTEDATVSCSKIHLYVLILYKKVVENYTPDHNFWSKKYISSFVSVFDSIKHAAGEERLQASSSSSAASSVQAEHGQPSSYRLTPPSSIFLSSDQQSYDTTSTLAASLGFTGQLPGFGVIFS